MRAKRTEPHLPAPHCFAMGGALHGGGPAPQSPLRFAEGGRKAPHPFSPSQRDGGAPNLVVARGEKPAVGGDFLCSRGPIGPPCGGTKGLQSNPHCPSVCVRKAHPSTPLCGPPPRQMGADQRVGMKICSSGVEQFIDNEKVVSSNLT